MIYRREIDGLRALAVVPVILFHAGFQAFSGGFVGVDVFFVISGYLITSIILAELETGTFSVVNFYERRARRILPALFFVMLACLPFAWLWLLPDYLKSFSQSLVAVPVFASNILFWITSGYFEPAAELKPLLHTWSLAVEEQYYVFFPLFLMLTWRLGRRWILSILAVLLVVSLAAAEWGSHAEPVPTFFLLPTRGWELRGRRFPGWLSRLVHQQQLAKFHLLHVCPGLHARHPGLHRRRFPDRGHDRKRAFPADHSRQTSRHRRSTIHQWSGQCHEYPAIRRS